MKIQSIVILSLLSFFCTVAYAEQSTGICKDGTTYTGSSKRGACRGHKGLQEWFADKAVAPGKATVPVTAAPPPAPAAAMPAPVTAAPAASLAGAATGVCKDGTAYTGSSKRGACRGHKGLQEWYADKPAAPAPAAAAAAPTATAAPAAPGTSISGTATGLCKDGTTYSGSSKRGACRGHKGLQQWYADEQTAPAKTAPAAATAAPVAATTAPSAAATGICKDGTEYTGLSKRGACRGHKGIKEWFGDKAAAPAAAATAPVTAPTGVAPAPSASPAAVQPVPAATQAAAPVAGGGAGMVWVNTRSKIYHCEGSKFYGKTKEGQYMTEAQAQAQNFVANRKKVCNISQ